MRFFAPLPTALALLLSGLAPAAAETASLLADLRLVLIVPQPIVRAASQEVGSMSRPSLFGEMVIDVSF